MSRDKLNICLLLGGSHISDMMIRAQRAEIYGKQLPGKGHKITFILPCGKQDEERLKKAKEYFHPSVKILTIPGVVKVSKINKLNKLVTIVTKAKMINKYLKNGRYDIFHVRNDILGGLIGIRTKRRMNTSFVFQYGFPSGEKMIEESKKKFKKDYSGLVFGKLTNCLSYHIIRRADLTITMSDTMTKELTKIGLPSNKMYSLQGGVNVDLFSPEEDSNIILKRFNLTKDKTVIYLGSLNNIRDLEFLLRSFDLVLKVRNDAKLLMVGDGDYREELISLTKKMGINKQVIFTGSVPYQEVPAYLSTALIGVSPIPPLPVYIVSSPFKLFEYMSLGIALVGNREIPEQKEVIQKSGAGLAVPYTEIDFAAAITKLFNNPEMARRIGAYGREWVIKNRSYKNMARDVEKKYYELLESYNR